MTIDDRVISLLAQASTATLTTVLFKKGLRNTWIRGSLPLTSGQPRVAAPAFTLRFIAGREDINTPAAWSSPTSTRAAVEAMPAGCFAVADALGRTDAGIFGDILCARMHVRGVKGLVSDGVVRDRTGVISSELPTWCNGTAAPPAVAQLAFVGWEQPISCGGVAIFPGDIVVADDDGAIVIPAAMAEEVASVAAEQEELENWILNEVRGGHPLTGLYPLSPANEARYRSNRGVAARGNTRVDAVGHSP
jgi:regulator of RNase E activity RraA